ncbi:hypothetical protein CR513_36507, partial [Mucuna pruriens]
YGVQSIEWMPVQSLGSNYLLEEIDQLNWHTLLEASGKVNLTYFHPKLYKLKWLSEKGELVVNRCKFPPFLGENNSDACLDWKIKENEKPLCAKMKKELRERFVRTYYARDLYVKLQRLYQGSKSIKEYFKEKEIYMRRA